jgi:PAS domain S-box-containing protein
MYNILDFPKASPIYLYMALAVFPPNEKIRFNKAIASAIKGDSIYNIDYKIILNDGQPRIIHDEGEVVFDEHGTAIRMFGTTQDITERKKSEEVLNLFRALIDQSNDAIEVSDPETGRFLDVNETAIRTLGYSREEIRSLGVLDIDITVNLSQYTNTIKELRKSGTLLYEGIHKRKDGSTFPVEVNIKYIKLDREYIITVVRDITGRKRVEEELQRSELRFRTLYENAKIGLYRTKPDGTILMANKALIKMLGYSSFEKLAERNLENDIYEPEYQRKEFLEKIEKDGVINDYELFWVCQDGRVFFASESARATRDPQGTTLYYDGEVEDITERKRSEEEILMLAHSLRSINECVSISDLEDNIIFVNEAFLKTYGYNENELIGKNLEMVCSPNNSMELIKEILPGTLRGGWKGELLNLRKDGSEFPIYLSTTIIFDKDNKPLGLIGVSTDISVNKKTEEEIKRTSKELEKLNSEKDKLFSIIAHDLRSPFHGLLGLTELMAKESHEMSSEEIKEYSKSLNSAVLNLYKLLENLLEWAQFQKGSLTFMPKSLNLSGIFLQSIDSIKQRAIQKGITIINEISENQIIYADEKMINSVLRNLLSNAVKFTPKGGRVIGKSREIEEGMVEISVTDTGIGIPGDTIRKLFMYSEKVGRKGTDNELSTGLGLVLCKEFVEKNGGRIWVESKEGNGSTFRFTLKKTE